MSKFADLLAKFDPKAKKKEEPKKQSNIKNEKSEGNKSMGQKPKIEESKNKNSFAERLKFFQNSQQPKKEGKAKVLEQTKKENIMPKTITSKPIKEQPKKEEKKDDKKEQKETSSFPNGIKNMNSDSPKKEEIQPKQEINNQNNSIGDKIKNLNKNEEKNLPKKEEPKKMGNLASRINFFNNNNQAKKEVPKEQPKKLNKISDKSKNMFEKNETTSTASIKPSPAPAFQNKISQMSEMFKNRGIGPGVHRPSMMIKMPQGFGIGKESQGDGSSGDESSTKNDEDIIKDIVDTNKEGYDPSANLQKYLDAVVIQKYKKKRRKTIFLA